MQEDRPPRPHSPGFEATITIIDNWFLNMIHERAGVVSPPGTRYEPVLDYIERQIRDQRTTLDAPAAAAIVLHGIITRHPFWDGNKRTAFIAAEAILFLGNMRFEVGMDDRFNFCLDLARKAEEAEKEGVDPPTIEEVERWIREHSVEQGLVARFIQWIILEILTPFFILREIIRARDKSREAQ